MGTTLTPAAEEQLVRWVYDLRTDGVPVTGLMLRLQAQELYETCRRSPGAFSGSWTWRKHFLRRHHLTIRRRTRDGQTTPEDAIQAAEAFGRQVRDKMSTLGVSKVFNADQTAVNYEYVPATTVHARGANTVWVKCAGKTKERVTVMLLGDSDGNKFDPFVVFKTRPSTRTETAVENEAVRHGFGRHLWGELEPLQDGVQLHGNTVGWWNSGLSIHFLYYHFGRRANMHEPVLLLWDDFSGHWRKDVVIFARLINVELMRVPPGYTYTCQPADIAWNRPLKDYLRKQWVNFLLAQVRAAGPGVAFRTVPPKRADVIRWVKSVWAALTRSTIIAGFRKAQQLSISTPAPDSSPSGSAEASHPDWSSLVRLLRSSPFPTVTVDAAKDIDVAHDEEDDEPMVEAEV